MTTDTLSLRRLHLRRLFRAKQSFQMKKAFYLIAAICTFTLMSACKNGTTTEPTAAADTSDIPQYNETRDVYAEGNQVEYVLIFPSTECIEQQLHEAEKDSVTLEGFYIAHDDLAWYYHLCAERLEEMGVVYYWTSADKTVHYTNLGEQREFRPEDGCDFGVFILDYVHEPEFIDLIDFLTLTDDTVQYPRKKR